jgi:hypothetical protein
MGREIWQGILEFRRMYEYAAWHQDVATSYVLQCRGSVGELKNCGGPHL